LAEATGDSWPLFTDFTQGTAYLSALLERTACLLVLDDVWEAAHVSAFGAPGRSRILITTQNRTLLTDLGAAEFRLDGLSSSQALALLAKWANQDARSLPAAASEVAIECGHLPLALAMIGAVVRGRPDRWSNVLHRLRSGDIEHIARDFPNYPYPSVFRAMQVSVEALDTGLRQRYLDFALFDSETVIPIAALDVYWAPLPLSHFGVENVVDALVDRSLLQQDADGLFRMHGLQLAFVRKQVVDPGRLHNRMLSAYRSQAPHWSNGPRDGYFFENLARHLDGAGRGDDLLELLREDAAGKNAWYEARVEAGAVIRTISTMSIWPGSGPNSTETLAVL
jgi:hypothetical protein